MSREYDAVAYDDEIDLREYLEVLWKGRWVILALVAAAVGLAGVLSFAVIPPTFQATEVLALPVPQDVEDATLRMDLQAYSEFALSAPVMAGVLETLDRDPGAPLTIADMATRFDVRLNEKAGLLTVDASARNPEEAYRLVLVWHDAFVREVERFWTSSLDAKLTSAEESLAHSQRAYWDAREKLDEFDLQNPLGVLEDRLSRLEKELGAVESKLRDLQLDAIPTDRARVSFLQDALAQEPRTLGESGERVAAPDVRGNAGVLASDVTLLNPVYLQLSQDLTATRTRLTTNESQAASLERRREELPAEISQLRAEVLRLRALRDELSREAEAAAKAYTQARERRDALESLKARLTELAWVDVVSPPTIPPAPIAPRKMLNMAVAAVMAGFLGVLYVSIRQWWAKRGTEPSEDGPSGYERSMPRQGAGP